MFPSHYCWLYCNVFKISSFSEVVNCKISFAMRRDHTTSINILMKLLAVLLLLVCTQTSALIHLALSKKSTVLLKELDLAYVVELFLLLQYF